MFTGKALDHFHINTSALQRPDAWFKSSPAEVGAQTKKKLDGGEKPNL